MVENPDRGPVVVGWRVRDLVSTLSVADGAVRLVEEWSVVADQTLDELLVDLNLDVTPDRQLTWEVFGGELTGDRWPDSVRGRRVLGIRLPEPLLSGQVHDFEFALSSTGGRPIDRHVYIPAVACARLDLRVHFGGRNAPRRVTPIAGRGSHDRPGADRAAIDTDPAGDARVAFADLTPGQPYGLRWEHCPH